VEASIRGRIAEHPGCTAEAVEAAAFAIVTPARTSARSAPTKEATTGDRPSMVAALA
jgi:hypothetical protein